MRLISLFLCAALVAANVSAQEATSEIEDFNSRGELLEFYDGSDELPIERSFYGFVRTMVLLEDLSPDDGIHYLAMNTPFSEEEARNLFPLLRDSNTQISTRLKSEPREQVCDGNQPREYADSGYGLIDEMWAKENEILQDEYVELTEKLDSELKTKFNTALEDHKSSVVFWRLDHRKIDQRKGQSVDALLTKLCIS
ncbi:MAG: hypothetical protein WBN09_08340 [Woeseiaceae bacterium]|jgi:hypothetical protein